MTKIGEMLPEKGLVYLAVPTGRDTLVWNAHRIYGNLRLPLLFSNWELLNTFGYPWYIKILHRLRQPVFVLRKHDN